MVADGDQVAFAGFFDIPTGMAPGDRGVVLSANLGGGGYVQWRTGARVGQVDYVSADELRVEVQARRSDPLESSLDDSLEIGPRVAVREVFEEQGEDGLFAALVEAGALSGLAQIAEDVVAMAAARVRSDLAPVLVQLDPEEAESVVNIATAACVREALGA